MTKYRSRSYFIIFSVISIYVYIAWFYFYSAGVFRLGVATSTFNPPHWHRIRIWRIALPFLTSSNSISNSKSNPINKIKLYFRTCLSRQNTEGVASCGSPDSTSDRISDAHWWHSSISIYTWFIYIYIYICNTHIHFEKKNVFFATRLIYSPTLISIWIKFIHIVKYVILDKHSGFLKNSFWKNCKK